MTKADFKARLKFLGLSNYQASKILRVSRYAVMHWQAGRRRIPMVNETVLDDYAARKHKIGLGEWKAFWEFWRP
jgi:hypothetical protein